ncbi:MAG: MATE family efflux transporter [Gammaproteobacteria bacterium]
MIQDHLPQEPRGFLSDKSTYGVFNQLWKITIPLMLATLSGSLMMFVDRLFLAHYSTAAMNAATSTGMTFAIFQFGAVSIASIAEVFVGQFNGAKQFHKIGPSVWQMIWFAVATAPIFWVMALFGEFFIAEALLEEGLPFFQILMILGAGFPLFSALSAFFIGRGQAGVITIAVIMSGLLNAALDYVLIFGWGPFPEMGTAGAALATGLAQWAGVLFLFTIFYSETHRKQYATDERGFDKGLFLNCLQIGTPNALGHMLVIGGWALMLNMLSRVSFEHMTVFAVGQSIWILTNFATDGGNKGATALTANLIGEKQLDQIGTVLKAGVLLHCCLVIVAALPLLWMPEVLVSWFLPTTEDTALMAMCVEACRWVWVAFFFDGLMWIVIGILIAGGDTRFVMLMSTAAGWLFGLLPVYIFITLLGWGPPMTMFLVMIFTICGFICFYARYRLGDWLKLQLTESVGG